MRFAILCAVVLCFLASGCGPSEDSTIISAPSEDSGALVTKPDQTMPIEGNHTPSAPSLGTSDGIVELDAITLTAPADWTHKPAGSSFVAAEFALPRAEGDDADGRLTVSTAGGSIEANIDRWKGQFQSQATEPSQEEVDLAGLKATIVDLSGTFNAQRGPFAPGEIRPAYRMIAAVIPVNNQLYFIKATGPQKTIAAHAKTIQEFIRSARLKS